MFDNPEEELNRLQQELLARESEDSLEDIKLLLEDADWDGRNRQPLSQSYAEPEDALYEDTEEEQLPLPKQKGNGMLIAAIVLELLAVAAAAAWWFLWR